jgi:hypothetical protein
VLGQQLETTTEIILYEPNRMVRGESIAALTPVVVVRSYEETPGGTDFSYMLESDVSQVRLFRLLRPLLTSWYQGHVERYLQKLKADVAWYGLRSWIECGFKDAKRGGWHWEQTKMSDPRRAERLWLAMALATLWVVSVGCQAEVSELEALPAQHIARRQTATARAQRRVLSCFRRGRLLIVATLLNGQALPLGQFVSEAWPKSFDTHIERPLAYRPLQKAA